MFTGLLLDNNNSKHEMFLCVAVENKAFASWHVQMFRMLVQGQVLRTAIALLFGISLSICSYVVGTDFGELVIFALRAFQRTGLGRRQQSEPQQSYTEDRLHRMTPYALLLTFCLLLSGLITGSIVDNEPIVSNRRFFWTSASFAPVGATLRWQLSVLNSQYPKFPIGTFSANMIAVILDVAIITALRIHTDVSTEASFILSSIITGLGGSLSTVSTWVAESLKLPRGSRYIYIFGTTTAAFAIGIVVYGAAYWSS